MRKERCEHRAVTLGKMTIDRERLFSSGELKNSLLEEMALELNPER